MVHNDDVRIGSHPEQDQAVPEEYQSHAVGSHLPGRAGEHFTQTPLPVRAAVTQLVDWTLKGASKYQWLCRNSVHTAIFVGNPEKVWLTPGSEPFSILFYLRRKCILCSIRAAALF